MQKTKKSIAKRFKLTKKGKVLRRTPGRRHIMRNKSQKQKRTSLSDKPTSQAVSEMVKEACPFRR